MASLPCEAPIFSITRDLSGSLAAVQLMGGTLLKFTLETEELLPWESAGGQDEVTLAAVCPRAKVVTVQEQHYFLGLSEKHRLYRYNHWKDKWRGSISRKIHIKRPHSVSKKYFLAWPSFPKMIRTKFSFKQVLFYRTHSD